MKKIIPVLAFFIVATDVAAFKFANPLCKLEYNTFNNEFSVSESCYRYFVAFSLTCRPTAKAAKNLGKRNNSNEESGSQATEVSIHFNKAQEKKSILARDASGKVITGYSLLDFSKDLNKGLHRKCEIGFPIELKEDW